ncbi:MAG: response regulator [Thioalkalispiraceae bacterium]|jgi:FixJ family two-component response regulator
MIENIDQTVFIVDDDDAIRDSLSMLMHSDDLQNKTFKSAESFLEQYNPDLSGCLLLDVRMPGMSGLDLQRHLIEQDSRLPIIVMSGHADIPTAVEMMKNGALDFYTKPFDNMMLLDSIKICLQHNEQLRNQINFENIIDERIQTLTKREREVLVGVLEGKASKVIAYDLGISVKTVDVHRSRIMEKMKVRSLAELVRTILNSNKENLLQQPQQNQERNFL